MKQADCKSQGIPREGREKNMKRRTLVIAVMVFVLSAGSALAQMGGGRMNMGGGLAGAPGAGPGTGHMGGGAGSGMAGGTGMMGNGAGYGYLGTLHPIATAAAAEAAFQTFIATANGALEISELWEYGTVYKAELSYANGAKAFDLIADKFTGVVTQEMGMSMMANAGNGHGLYGYPAGRTPAITAAQAQAAAQAFIDTNALGYALQPAETYPGYYKFHTSVGANPSFWGMDIMVNGSNGQIWMSTILGLPVERF